MPETSAPADPGTLLVDQLRVMADLVPDEVGFRHLDAGTALTFRQWDEESNRLARGLAGAGIAQGERVAVHLPGRLALHWVLSYAAVHKAGAVAVPTNTRLTPTELGHVLRHAEVLAVVTSSDHVDAFEAVRPELSTLRLVVGADEGVPDSTAWDDVLDPDRSRFQVAVGPDDLADIMYTSGTTGLPKGVAVTHGNVAMVPNSLPAWSGNRWIHSSPLFTFAGIGFIYNPMKMGMASLYQARFDAGRWLDYVEEHRPTFAFIVPAMAQLIVSHERFEAADLSSIELCSVGSAPLPFEVLRALQEKIPHASVSNSYGMTEAGAAYCVMPQGESLRRKGSVGLPLPPAEIRIVDEDLRDVERNEDGEILIRVPGKQRSYYRDPEATAEAWEEGGWLHTGDLGFIDDDGYLYIVGRMKDVIIRGGHNIHAGDVESVLYEHPGVLEAAVTGIPHDVLGEDVAAFVVVREGAEVDAAEVEAFCRERLADYKAPRTVVFVDELPRNATGKVVKRELVEQFERS